MLIVYCAALIWCSSERKCYVTMYDADVVKTLNVTAALNGFYLSVHKMKVSEDLQLTV